MKMHDILMLIQNQLRGKRFLAKVALVLGPDVGMSLALMADHVSARLEDDRADTALVFRLAEGFCGVLG
jgi:hypothetical protein